MRYDIYSLGVSFYNMLTGEYPFEGKNAAHVMEKHLREPAPSPSARNPRLTQACDRAPATTNEPPSRGGPTRW